LGGARKRQFLFTASKKGGKESPEMESEKRILKGVWEVFGREEQTR